jgi:hypothetical protein
MKVDEKEVYNICLIENRFIFPAHIKTDMPPFIRN